MDLLLQVPALPMYPVFISSKKEAIACVCKHI